MKIKNTVVVSVLAVLMLASSSGWAQFALAGEQDAAENLGGGGTEL